MKETVSKNIYQRISDVMADVSYLQKDDDVPTGNGKSYKAITEEKVTSAIRAAMIKHGLVIVPIRQEHTRTDETVETKYGNRINRITEVDTTYRIQNIDNPDDYIEAVSSGTGADTQDKGIGKAMTYAYKYLLLRTFAIPTGEDADKISSEKYDEELNSKKSKASTKTDTKAQAEQDDYLNAPADEKSRSKLKEYCEKVGGDLGIVLQQAGWRKGQALTNEHVGKATQICMEIEQSNNG